MSGRRVLEATTLGKWWRPQPVPDQRVACTDRYRGPHNRCRHPTPDPRGNRRCAADPACPCMLPADSPRRLCGWHDDEWTDTGMERARRELGGFSGA